MKRLEVIRCPRKLKKRLKKYISHNYILGTVYDENAYDRQKYQVENRLIDKYIPLP